MSQEKNYESTVMRVAGNLLSGVSMYTNLDDDRDLIYRAVRRARKIVAEVQRTAASVDVADEA